jgi:hypothetical protein
MGGWLTYQVLCHGWLVGWLFGLLVSLYNGWTVGCMVSLLGSMCGVWLVNLIRFMSWFAGWLVVRLAG